MALIRFRDLSAGFLLHLTVHNLAIGNPEKLVFAVGDRTATAGLRSFYFAGLGPLLFQSEPELR